MATISVEYKLTVPEVIPDVKSNKDNSQGTVAYAIPGGTREAQLRAVVDTLLE